MNRTVNITCQDGYRIASERFEPSTPALGEILMAGATGVPQRFYKRFAQFATQRGYAVTTLDYRGIGKSAPPTLRGFKANYTQWAKQDLAAVLEHVVKQARSGAQPKPVRYVAHSFGGHALGQLPNHQTIESAYFFAVGAGWAGHMPTRERIKVNFLWHALGPLLVPALGYMPGKLIGGENLPLGVYQQWKHWCGYKRYFLDDPRATHIAAEFSSVVMPITAANATDDLWALPVSRDHFMQGYTNAKISRVDLQPKTLGMPIGHMGYFRQGREALWEDCLNTLS